MKLVFIYIPHTKYSYFVFDVEKKPSNMYPLPLFIFLMLHFGSSEFCFASFFQQLIWFFFVFFQFLEYFVYNFSLVLLLALIASWSVHWSQNNWLIFPIAEHTSVKVKKDDPFVQQLWKQTRSNKVDQADMLYDIIIPTILIVGLLVVNAFILLIIWRYRMKR